MLTITEAATAAEVVELVVTVSSAVISFAFCETGLPRSRGRAGAALGSGALVGSRALIHASSESRSSCITRREASFVAAQAVDHYLKII